VVTIVYYDMSQAIIFVFDIRSKESLEDAKNRVKLVSEMSSKKPKLFLVANFVSNAENNKNIKQNRENALKYAKTTGIHYHEVSAKIGSGVPELAKKMLYYSLGESSGIQKVVEQENSNDLENDNKNESLPKSMKKEPGQIKGDEKTCAGCIVI